MLHEKRDKPKVSLSLRLTLLLPVLSDLDRKEARKRQGAKPSSNDSIMIDGDSIYRRTQKASSEEAHSLSTNVSGFSLVCGKESCTCSLLAIGETRLDQKPSSIRGEVTFMYLV